eukprot:UN28674
MVVFTSALILIFVSVIIQWRGRAIAEEWVSPKDTERIRYRTKLGLQLMLAGGLSWLLVEMSCGMQGWIKHNHTHVLWHVLMAYGFYCIVAYELFVSVRFYVGYICTFVDYRDPKNSNLFLKR